MRTPVLRDRGKILLADYNRWRDLCTSTIQRRAAGVIHDLKPTRERLDVLEEMAEWCHVRGMDDRLWLYLLFRQSRWFWPPQIKPGHLMNEQRLNLYREAKGLDAYRRLTVPASQAQANDYDPNRDLAPYNEAVKARLIDAGHADRCISRMVEETLGYHPASEVCRRCPKAAECLARLKAWCDFDVEGLRRGLITAEFARSQANAAKEARR